MAPGWSRFHVHRMAPIIKKKTAPLLKNGAVFQNSSRVEPFWLHFFFIVFRKIKVTITKWPSHVTFGLSFQHVLLFTKTTTKVTAFFEMKLFFSRKPFCIKNIKKNFGTASHKKNFPGRGFSNFFYSQFFFQKVPLNFFPGEVPPKMFFSRFPPAPLTVLAKVYWN